ncbi:MAG: glycosyltransferase family 2 protein [Kiritimatiellia bacterium]
MHPFVSVIVPNRNHARFLSQRIESILGQTFGDFELILLDDASTDESRQIMAQYASDPRTRIVINEECSGSPFKQWNKGVGLGRGELVWIAESDDYAEKNFLAELVEVLKKNPRAALACTNSHWITEDGSPFTTTARVLARVAGNLWQHDFVADGRRMVAQYFAIGNMIPNASAVVFRKRVYLDIGGAPEHMRLCGDWMTWVQLLMFGEMVYRASPLNYYRSHPATVRSMIQADLCYALEWLEVSQHVFSRVNVSPAVRKLAIRELRGRWYRILNEGIPPIPRTAAGDFVARVRSIFGRAAALSFHALQVERVWRRFYPARALFSIFRRIFRRCRGDTTLPTPRTIGSGDPEGS